MITTNNGIAEFISIRSKVLNSLLLYMSIGSLPLLATSLLNFYSSGWKFSMVFDVIGLLSLPVVYLFRNRLNYIFRSAYLIISGYSASMLILRDYSFLGTGLIILSSVTLISTLFFGIRFGWIFMTINIVSIVAIGLLFQYNYLQYDFDFGAYIHSSFTWIDQVTSFAFFIGILVIASGEIHKALVKLIRQAQTEKEKFKGLFNNIPDAIMIHTIDGEILEVNNSLFEMFGTSRNSVFTSKAKDFSIWLPFKTNDIETTNDFLVAKRHYETKASRFDNKEEFFVEVMLTPIEYGEQKAILANIRDITQRKMTEEALLKSEEKYRHLTEASPGSIFIVQDGVFRYVNPAGAEKLGYRYPDELTGKNATSLIAPEFKDLVEQRLKQTIMKKRNQPLEIKIINARGIEMWAETISIPFDYNLSPAALVMGFDITERKKAESMILQKNQEIENRNNEYALLNQKLQIAKDKAEESDKLKSAFLSNMSHEIRTPMNAILGFSDLLIKTSLTEKKRTAYIEIINSSGNQLLSLINDIIDISKIESNQIIIDNSTQVNIQDIFEQLAAIFMDKAKKQKILLEYKIQNDLSRVRVFIDEIRLKQVLTNLIGNALKFTPHGYVRFECSLRDKDLLFTVEDSGIGIEPQQQLFIFERFRQADDSTSRDYGGTGLGLSISKALVELMGGKIWLNSIPGKGTIFYFTMPIGSSVDIISTDQSFEIDISVPHSWKNKTILIVEDEEANVIFLSEVLRPSKLKVLVAENAAEALDIIEEDAGINLILMDIKIPGMNGFELTQLIKQKYRHIPVIAQTAYALAEERREILESGFDDYLSKPINTELLFGLLTRYLT